MEKELLVDKVRDIAENLSAINNMFIKPSYYRDMYMPYNTNRCETNLDKKDYTEYGKYLEYYSRRLLEILESEQNSNVEG